MSKIFRIDWYPHNAYADFLKLNVEEIAVITQVINLIYINEGPIENDPKWISRSVNDLGIARCRNIINKLIQNGDLYITENGKISKKMCENQLKNVKKRRKNDEDFQKISENYQNTIEQNQQDNFSFPTSTNTNTNTSTNTNKHPNTQSNNPRDEKSARGDGGVQGVFFDGKDGGGVSPPGRTSSFNIEHLLSGEGIELARQGASGWDIYALMRTYSEGVNNGHREPPKYPDKAFAAWVKRYTKGKKP